MSEIFFPIYPKVKDDDVTICDKTAATIIIEKDDDDEHDLNQTAATIIINPYDYATNNEVYQLKEELEQLRNEVYEVRQQNSALLHKIQHMECRDDCNHTRIEKLEKTVSKLVRYINAKGD